MSQMLHLLILEDDPYDADLTIVTLEEAGYAVDAGAVHPLGRAMFPSPGVTDECVHFRAVEAELASLPNVRILRRTTVFGVYDHGTYGAVERGGEPLAEPGGRVRETLWRITARHAILAAGATEWLEDEALMDAGGRYATLFTLQAEGYRVKDLSDNEMAKLHVRHMVGGRSPNIANERLYRFEFPERPGALLDFLNAIGTGWNIIQSKIAVGSGGLTGKGWLNGTQSNLEFIPERHTDFILAVLSEEFGLAGVLLLMLAYMMLIARGLYIAGLARDTGSRLLAGALSLTLFVYYVFDYTLPGRSQRYLGHDEGFRLVGGPHVSWRVAAAARAYLSSRR